MNVFVVARDAGPTSTRELVQMLDTIQTESAARSSIVAVDSFYNLPVASGAEGECMAFQLDDFVHAKGSITDGKVILDTNRIAEQVGSADQGWLVVDFGQHRLETGQDFIAKLAACFYMLPPAQQRKLAFRVARVQLPLYLRASNAAFNVLPETRGESSGSLQTNMLFLSAGTEKFVERLPLFKLPFAMLRALARFAMRRLSRRNGI